MKRKSIIPKSPLKGGFSSQVYRESRRNVLKNGFINDTSYISDANYLITFECHHAALWGDDKREIEFRKLFSSYNPIWSTSVYQSHTIWPADRANELKAVAEEYISTYNLNDFFTLYIGIPNKTGLNVIFYTSKQWELLQDYTQFNEEDYKKTFWQNCPYKLNNY